MLTVFSVQWYNDLILSHACREDKIILWSIDKFSSDRVTTPPAPIPTSSAVHSRTPVTIQANSTSKTLSAWGGRFQRLLQFELPHTNQFYIRFSIFHELGRHPILAAANEKSKTFFWDLQRLENSGMGEDGSQNAKGLPLGLPRHVREGSTASTASSAVSTNSGTTKAKQKKVKEQHIDRGISDPFRSIKAHKMIEIPKYKAFAFRHSAWSRDGQWYVGVGDCGTIAIFNRWEKGVPPISPDKELPTEEVSQHLASRTFPRIPDPDCTPKSDSRVVSDSSQVCTDVATDGKVKIIEAIEEVREESDISQPMAAGQGKPLQDGLPPRFHDLSEYLSDRQRRDYADLFGMF